MSTSTSPTGSILVGLLLAAVSAGSLIAFSLFAGDADNPTGATVAAARPDTDVTPVVLGTRVTREAKAKAETEVALSPRPDLSVPVAPPRPAADDDVVLGTRIKNQRSDRDRKAPTDDAAAPQGGREVASAPCSCGEARGENTPNGNAYGYHKQASNRGNNGLARGHSEEPSNGHGNAGANGRARGHGKKP